MDEQKRILGIDPGEKRVGLAVSDPLRLTAQGLDTFRRGTGSIFDHLRELSDRFDLGGVVLGHPLNMDGSEGEAAISARRFAGRLEEQLALPVVLWDERLSSRQARRSYPPGSRKDWDKIAAVLILQSWLDAQRGEA